MPKNIGCFHSCLASETVMTGNYTSKFTARGRRAWTNWSTTVIGINRRLKRGFYSTATIFVYIDAHKLTKVHGFIWSYGTCSIMVLHRSDNLHSQLQYSEFTTPFILTSGSYIHALGTLSDMQQWEILQWATFWDNCAACSVSIDYIKFACQKKDLGGMTNT